MNFGDKRKEEIRKAELWDKLVAAAGAHRVRVVIVDPRATKYGMVDTADVLIDYLNDDTQAPKVADQPEEIASLYKKIREYTRRLDIPVIIGRRKLGKVNK